MLDIIHIASTTSELRVYKFALQRRQRRANSTPSNNPAPFYDWQRCRWFIRRWRHGDVDRESSSTPVPSANNPGGLGVPSCWLHTPQLPRQSEPTPSLRPTNFQHWQAKAARSNKFTGVVSLNIVSGYGFVLTNAARSQPWRPQLCLPASFTMICLHAWIA